MFALPGAEEQGSESLEVEVREVSQGQILSVPMRHQIPWILRSWQWKSENLFFFKI